MVSEAMLHMGGKENFNKDTLYGQEKERSKELRHVGSCK